LNHPATWRFPGGESLQEQSDRVAASLRQISHTGELPALVVCHGGSIRVAQCLADARGLAAFHEFVVPNVAVVRV
jgi:broad specificity phosphatase PhoE